MRWTGKVDPPVVFGPPGELVRVFPGGALDEYALHSADHPFTDRTGLALELRLQPAQPLLLDLGLNFVRQRRRGRTRTSAVEEAERLVEVHVAHECERGIEITLALARETDDEIGRHADVRPHLS